MAYQSFYFLSSLAIYRGSTVDEPTKYVLVTELFRLSKDGTIAINEETLHVRQNFYIALSIDIMLAPTDLSYSTLLKD